MEHEIAVSFDGSDIPLKNSPQRARLGSHPSGQPLNNFIPNAELIQWPNGVLTRPRERFSEIAAHWYFDFRQGTEPDAAFSLADLSYLSRAGTMFGMRVTFDKAPNGYARLVIPLDDTVRRYSELTCH